MNKFKLSQDFDKLSDIDKRNYVNGFKMGFNLYQMKDNDNIKLYVNKIFTYNNESKQPVPVKENPKEQTHEYITTSLKEKNKILIDSFENILTLCTPLQKTNLIKTLKIYMAIH